MKEEDLRVRRCSKRLQYNLVEEEVVTERQTQDGVYCREVYIELG